MNLTKYSKISYLKDAIFIAATAASAPLFPCSPPDLAMDCDFLWSVKTQKITGVELEMFSCIRPFETELQIKS